MAGLAVMVLTTPFLAFIVTRMMAITHLKLAHNDARMRLISDTFQSIRVIKVSLPW